MRRRTYVWGLVPHRLGHSGGPHLHTSRDSNAGWGGSAGKCGAATYQPAGCGIGLQAHLHVPETLFVSALLSILPPVRHSCATPHQARVEAYASAAGTSHRLQGGNRPDRADGGSSNFRCVQVTGVLGQHCTPPAHARVAICQNGNHHRSNSNIKCHKSCRQTWM